MLGMLHDFAGYRLGTASVLFALVACSAGAGHSRIPESAGAGEVARACADRCEQPASGALCQQFSPGSPEICDNFLAGESAYRHPSQDYALSQYGGCMSVCERSAKAGDFCIEFGPAAIDVCAWYRVAE